MSFAFGPTHTGVYNAANFVRLPQYILEYQPIAENITGANLTIATLQELQYCYSFGTQGNTATSALPAFTITLPNPDTDGYVFNYEVHSTATNNVTLTTIGGSACIRTAMNVAAVSSIARPGSQRFAYVTANRFWLQVPTLC